MQFQIGQIIKNGRSKYMIVKVYKKKLRVRKFTIKKDKKQLGTVYCLGDLYECDIMK